MNQTNHTSYEVLQSKLAEAARLVAVGEKYAHYKHPEKPYVVLHLGLLEATEEVCVMYQDVESGVVWVRTLEKFLDTVEWNDKKVPRFVKLG